MKNILYGLCSMLAMAQVDLSFGAVLPTTQEETIIIPGLANRFALNSVLPTNRQVVVIPSLNNRAASAALLGSTFGGAFRPNEEDVVIIPELNRRFAVNSFLFPNQQAEVIVIPALTNRFANPALFSTNPGVLHVIINRFPNNQPAVTTGPNAQFGSGISRDSGSQGRRPQGLANQSQSARSDLIFGFNPPPEPVIQDNMEPGVAPSGGTHGFSGPARNGMRGPPMDAVPGPPKDLVPAPPSNLVPNPPSNLVPEPPVNAVPQPPANGTPGSGSKGSRSRGPGFRRMGFEGGGVPIMPLLTEFGKFNSIVYISESTPHPGPLPVRRGEGEAYAGLLTQVGMPARNLGQPPRLPRLSPPDLGQPPSPPPLTPPVTGRPPVPPRLTPPALGAPPAPSPLTLPDLGQPPALPPLTPPDLGPPPGLPPSAPPGLGQPPPPPMPPPPLPFGARFTPGIA